MRELAQKNQRTGGRLLGLAALMATLVSALLPRAHIAGLQPSGRGMYRTEHKAERQRVRYARMHNRKGSHV